MTRTFRTTFITFLLLLTMVIPPSFAFADGPAPAAKGEMPKVSLPAEAPSIVKQTVELRESLSAEQLAAMQGVLAKYEPKFGKVAQKLPALSAKMDPTKVDVKAAPSEAALAEAQKNLQAAQAMADELAALQKQIDAELSLVLTADQMALYRAGLQPAEQLLGALNAAAEKDAVKASARPEAPQLNSTYCYYACYYASLGRYYGYYGYVYAYYNYVTYGTTNGYYGYLYQYYGIAYAYDALCACGAGYFDLLATGKDFNGFLYASISKNYNAYLYQYYGYYYSAADYSNGGKSYAYYAYIYSYYGYYYSYYGYIYAYYCYYN